jgi:hypothetical protein
MFIPIAIEEEVVVLLLLRAIGRKKSQIMKSGVEGRPARHDITVDG